MLLLFKLKVEYPLLIFFHIWNKKNLYWFLSSLLEYDSNEKYLEAWSGAHFYKIQHYFYTSISFYIMKRRKLYTVDKNAQFISLHNKFKIMLYA